MSQLMPTQSPSALPFISTSAASSVEQFSRKNALAVTKVNLAHAIWSRAFAVMRRPATRPSAWPIAIDLDRSVRKLVVSDREPAGDELVHDEEVRAVQARGVSNNSRVAFSHVNPVTFSMTRPASASDALL